MELHGLGSRSCSAKDRRCIAQSPLSALPSSRLLGGPHRSRREVNLALGFPPPPLLLRPPRKPSPSAYLFKICLPLRAAAWLVVSSATWTISGQEVSMRTRRRRARA